MFKYLETKKIKASKSIENINLEGLVEVPNGMYEKCPECNTTIPLNDLQKNAWVCKECNYHFRIHVASRAYLHFDEFKVFHHSMRSIDPLHFPGYKEKLEDLLDFSAMYDAVVTGEAKINEYEVIAVLMDPSFMMGSMGSVVGEKITRAFERATKQKKPIIIFTASGGARMQEGMMSLMQMAKTSAAVAAFDETGGLFISVLTDPTTGGVTASFAMLGDIILAEPQALIAFAGPRVIKQTIQTDLPDGFQRSEYLLKAGFIDKIVHRQKLKSTLSKILEIHEVKS